MQTNTLTNITIIGASGYTGAELVRILFDHPHVTITQLIAESNAGKPLGDIYPHLAFTGLPDLIALDQADWSKTDIVFACLPHGTSQRVIAALPEHLKIIDLSADFRLADVNAYAAWYGHAHHAPELQKQAVYGLTEWAREQVKSARLIANPGCYPTGAQLPLIPLLKAKMVEPHGIIIDAKSGVTGAGRASKQNFLFAEVEGGLYAYGIGSHRHAPEIEQGLSQAVGEVVTVTFTPHLIPMKRGILSTIYVMLSKGNSADTLRQHLAKTYAKSQFVDVLPEGAQASTHQVQGTNRCVIAVHADRVAGRAIIVSAIDNLVKGASGQAVQNMNVMMGWPEDTGLQQVALFP